MPVITNSSYKKPFFLFNRHLETIYPALLRKVKTPVKPEILRISTPDDDFLELDIYRQNSDKVIIISHGLEADSRRPYIKGMIRKFYHEDWDVVAWNYRGCSGELNHTAKFYHCGATYDLAEIVNYILSIGYSNIALLGFSLGGNLTLKYMGERMLPKQIKCGVAISSTIDLEGCSNEISQSHNFLYSKRFLKSLKKKVLMKSASMKLPKVDLDLVSKANSLYSFDDTVTAPLHGFSDAEDYYSKNSAMQFIENIQVPTLVLSALNDPFLSKSCFDQSKFKSSEQVYLEMPKFGGHVGFSQFGKNGEYWSETRAYDFISQHID